jgi:hypothetical protein
MTKKKVNLKIEECLLGDKQRESVYCAAEELCKFMYSNSRRNGESIINEIWPRLGTFKWDIEPVLKLLPLDRIGGEPGKSGITVLAGRFYANSRMAKKSTIPSRQMIVKISPEPDKDSNNNKRKELINEWDAVKHLKQSFKARSCFARPVWCYQLNESKPAVLWAPFVSPDPQYVGGSKIGQWKSIQPLEMVKYLSAAWASTEFQSDQNSRKNKLKGIITAVKYLFSAHSTKSQDYRETENLVDHYDWELRGFLTKKDEWPKKWYDLWTNDTVKDFGDNWPNPIRICKKLSKLGKRSLRMGHVHGDLHPRNIVFADNGNEVRIIDFGWARPQKYPRKTENRGPEHKLQHIVKDFVLLEANLRFMTLPPFLPYKSVTKFLNWINTERTPRKNIHDECKLRMELIKDLRETAKQHIGKHRNWNIEYIAPLFLVSLGLLKHCHSADCTWSARYTVLSLAKYLDNNLFKRRKKK